MKTMSDWLSRAAALPARLRSNRRQSENQCASRAARDQFVVAHAGLQSIHTGETKMISFKAPAAAVMLAATAATPAFAQAAVGTPPVVVPGSVSSDRALYAKNLHGSGYNP